MNSRLLVILLVLAAAGALFFTVSFLMGGEPGSGESRGVAPPVRTTTTSITDQGTETQPVAQEVRRDAAATPATRQDPGRVSEGVGFANELTGTVQDESGNPVAGARVTLTRHAAQMITFANEVVDRSGDRRTETNKSGAFSFVDIEPYAHYGLVVEHPDFARVEEPASPVAVSGKVQEPPIILHGGARMLGFVRNTAGDGIHGAELTLSGTFHGLGKNDSPDQLQVKSDNMGRYEFKNVPSGHRTLTISADGYGNAMIGGLQIDRGQEIERDVVLELAEMICGTVVGPGNVPLAGVEVIAMSYASGPRQSRDYVVTGPDGRFCLERVRPGQYTVAVTKPGFKADRLPRVEAGDTSLLFQLAPKSTISGVVLARDTGQPVSSFQIQLRVAYENTEQTGRVGPPVQVHNDRGEFLVDDVGEGIFMIEASADGYAPTFSERLRVGGSQEIAGVVIQLAMGGSIVGQIVDPGGQPVAGAIIETRDNDWSDDYFTRVVLGDEYPTNASTKQARSGADGRFRIDALNPENYQIRVKTDNFPELVQHDLRVVEQGTMDVGAVRLLAGGTVTGTVVGADGQAVPGAQIQLRPDGHPQAGRVLRNGKANDRGAFTIPNVVPGNYRISALAGSGNNADIFGPMSNQLRSERPVVVTGGGEQRVELKLGG